MTARDGLVAAAQYDAMGAAYGDDNAVNAFNAYYERPATISLLGDVAGKRVLEVGCGPGSLTQWLVEAGALVTAFDVSSEMVRLTTERVGDRATVRRHDLHEGLPFISDDGIDVVVASLVLHYLADWDSALDELRRVLAPDGIVVFSTHHPARDWEHTPADYFAIAQVTESWTRGSQRFDVTFWRRPLRAMTASIARAGFVIEALLEAEPLPELGAVDATADQKIRTQPFFLHFRLRARPGSWGRPACPELQ